MGPCIGGGGRDLRRRNNSATHRLQAQTHKVYGIVGYRLYTEYACAKCVRSSVKRALKSEWALVLVAGEEVHVEEITAQRTGCKRKRIRYMVL